MWKEFLISSIYPRRCPICDDVLAYPERICTKCRRKLPYVREPSCKKCGKPLDSEEAEYCYDCKKTRHYYDNGKALYLYNTDLKRSVEGFKYHNKREYSDFYADDIARHLGYSIQAWNADILIPVPIHQIRKRKRGYNQAELLAKKIGNKIGIPVDSEKLFRIKKTLPQKELNDIERRKNLEDAFHVDKNVVQYKKAIIIDDIYTTGSTIDACAKALKAAGVKYVYFICLCIGHGY